MQRELGNRGTYSQNAQWWSRFPEFWILLETPRDCCQRQRRPQRMPDNQNFINVGLANSFENLAGEIVDSFFNLRSLTIEKLSRKNRVIEDVIDPAPRTKPPHQSHENGYAEQGGAYGRPQT